MDQKDMHDLLENPMNISSEFEGLLNLQEVEDVVNNKIAMIELSKSSPNLGVGRVLLNDHGLWGYLLEKKDGKYKATGYTLEPTRNIPEKGYIPPGNYRFKRWDSAKLKKTLRLYSVPNFTNVLVHVGNTKNDTRGCILAAKSIDDNKNPKRLVTSRVMTDYLYDNYPEGNIVVGWI